MPSFIRQFFLVFALLGTVLPASAGADERSGSNDNRSRWSDTVRTALAQQLLRRNIASGYSKVVPVVDRTGARDRDRDRDRRKREVREVHVEDISMRLNTSRRSGRLGARAVIQIADDDGRPVKGARVRAYWKVEGKRTKVRGRWGRTDKRGNVRFTSPRLRRGEQGQFALTIAKVYKRRAAYDASANEESGACIDSRGRECEDNEGEITIASIDGKLKNWRNRWRAYAQVKVVDEEGDPVTGAVVRGHWQLISKDGESRRAGSMVRATNRRGVAFLRSYSRRAKPGDVFYLEVTDVTYGNAEFEDSDQDSLRLVVGGEDETPPTAPTGLTLVSTTQDSVALKWQPAKDDVGVIGYLVMRNDILVGRTTTTAFTDTGLAPETTFAYTVIAVDAAGNRSPASNAVKATTKSVVPAAPTDLVAQVLNSGGLVVANAVQASSHSVKLSWADNSTNETGFHVERREGATGVWATLTQLPAGSTGFQDTAVKPGTAYDYRVKAVGDAGASAYSNNASATVPDLPPSAPSNLVAKVANTIVTLSWTDNSSNETGFHLERREGATDAWARVALLPVGTTGHQDATVKAGLAYDYRVKAVATGSVSDFSNIASVKLPEPPPAAPSDLVASVAGNAVALKWLDNSNNETGFHLERREGATGAWAKIALLPAGGTSHQDTTVKAGLAYDYRVKAIGEGGASAFSNIASAKLPEPPPSAPTDLVAELPDSAVSLSWTDTSANETGFVVERKDDAIGTWGAIATLPAGTVRHQDAQIAPGKSYTYRVKATGKDADSPYSNLATVKIPVAPPTPPTNLVGAFVGGNVNLTWSDNSNNEDNFVVERQVGSGTAWTVLATLAANSAAHQDLAVPTGVTLFYRVKAVNSGGASAYSDTAMVVIPAAKPAAPSNLMATLAGDLVSLNWADNSGNETAFILERQTGSTGPWTILASLPADSNAHQDNTVAAATSYSYRVKASNADGDSAYSNLATVTVPAACVPTRQYFADAVLPDMNARCLGCHVTGGFASSTPLVLVSGGTADVNYDKVHAYWQQSDPKDKILQKTIGLPFHGGGAPYGTAASQEYKDLAQLLTQFATPLPCDSTPTPPTNPGDPASLQSVEMMDNQETLRKATLMLAGRLPTSDELAGVVTETDLRRTVRASMTGPGFERFLLETADTHFLTGGVTRSQPSNGLNRNEFPAMNAMTDTERRDAAREVPQEPLELLRFIVAGERPYSEIVTADYTMVNPLLARAYDAVLLDGPFVDPTDLDEWRRGRIPVASPRTSLPYPHSGVLTQLAWLYRFPTTATNRNRHRAKVLYQQFLGVDLEALAQRVLDDSGVFLVPTMENPNCTVCHNVMDPIAGAFQNWGENNHYREHSSSDSSLASAYRSSRYPLNANGERYYQAGDRWYRDVLAPGFDGTAMPGGYSGHDASLRWLAQEIVLDPRFAKGTVHFWYEGLFGRKPLAMPFDEADPAFTAKLRAYNLQDAIFDQVAEAFRNDQGNGAYNLKDMLVELVLSPWFRAETVADLTDERRIELAELGMGRLLTPEQLNRKLAAVTGTAWPRFDNPSDRYFLIYGGFDGNALTTRNSEINSLLNAVVDRIGNELGCGIVQSDFTATQANRLLFPLVEATDTPDNTAAEARIRQNLQHLYAHVLGETVATDSAEVGQSLALFREVWNGRNTPAGTNVGCTLASSNRDPLYTKRAWTMVLLYLLGDPRFLYE